jgi:hypothetical protein
MSAMTRDGGDPAGVPFREKILLGESVIPGKDVAQSGLGLSQFFIPRNRKERLIF